MPRFDISIDPSEYVSACGRKEIEELLDEIRRYEMYETRSVGQSIFNNHLNSLKQAWYSVSKEDADIIAIIAKKYGAL